MILNLLDFIRSSHTDCIEREVNNQERTQAHLNANKAKEINENRERIGWEKQ